MCSGSGTPVGQHTQRHAVWVRGNSVATGVPRGIATSNVLLGEVVLAHDLQPCLVGSVIDGDVQQVLGRKAHVLQDKEENNLALKGTGGHVAEGAREKTHSHTLTQHYNTTPTYHRVGQSKHRVGTRRRHEHDANVGGDGNDSDGIQDAKPHANVLGATWLGPAATVKHLGGVHAQLDIVGAKGQQRRQREGDDEESDVAKLDGQLVVVPEGLVVIQLHLNLCLRPTRKSSLIQVQRHAGGRLQLAAWRQRA